MDLFDFTKTKFRLSRPLWTYSKVQSIFGRYLRGKRLFYRPFPSVPFMIDIGPGAYAKGGFYNIDMTWMPGIDLCVDITNGIGLPHNQVCGAYTEHCLEHLDVRACISVLQEVHDALSVSSWIRIIVPDLELYCRRYIESIELEENVMPNKEIIEGAILETPAFCLNTIMRDYGHRFIYDFSTLADLLGVIGYRNVQKCSFGQGNDIRLLKDRESRRHESLYVEAQK